MHLAIAHTSIRNRITSCFYYSTRATGNRYFIPSFFQWGARGYFFNLLDIQRNFYSSRKSPFAGGDSPCRCWIKCVQTPGDPGSIGPARSIRSESPGSIPPVVQLPRPGSSVFPRPHLFRIRIYSPFQVAPFPDRALHGNIMVRHSAAVPWALLLFQSQRIDSPMRRVGLSQSETQQGLSSGYGAKRRLTSPASLRIFVQQR